MAGPVNQHCLFLFKVAGLRAQVTGTEQRLGNKTVLGLQVRGNVRYVKHGAKSQCRLNYVSFARCGGTF